MKKFITVIVAVALLFGCASLSGVIGEKTRTIYAMDTVMSLKIKGAERVLDEIEDMIYKYDKLFSAHNPESEIYRLNKGGSFEVSDATLEVIRLGIEYTKLTSGGFDITLKAVSDLWVDKVPDEAKIKESLLKTGISNIEINGNTVMLKNGCMLDLGGIAKGYITDKAREILKKNNVKYAVMDFGGNVYVYNKKSDMKVGIQKPFEPRGETAAVVTANDESVISSGVYERYFEENGRMYHHIIDAETGKPSEGELYSVTIIGENGAMCDAISTAGVVKGKEFLKELREAHGGFEYITIDRDGNIERNGQQYEL